MSLQASVVEDVDLTAAGTDDAFALEDLGANGDPRPARALHDRRELVRQVEPVAVDAVVAHEQPSREGFLQAVVLVRQRVCVVWIISTWTNLSRCC